jgi:hypothetical protein
MKNLRITAIVSTVTLLLAGCVTSPSAVELDTMRKQSQILEKLDALLASQGELGRRNASLERQLQDQKASLEAAGQAAPTILTLSQRQDIMDCKITSVAVHERCAVYLHGETDAEAFSSKLKECLVAQNFRDASTCTRPNWVTQK